MAVSLSRLIQVTATETLAATLPTLGSSSLSHSQLNTAAETFNSGTTVPVTVAVGVIVTLTAGSATLDLTAITDELGRTVDLSGLKVQSLRVKPHADNANIISMKPGASNGYNLGNSASFYWSGYGGTPPDEADFLWREKCPDVDATHKNLDFAGTGSQKILLQIVAG